MRFSGECLTIDHDRAPGHGLDTSRVEDLHLRAGCDLGASNRKVVMRPAAQGGIAATAVSTCSRTWLENRVPSRAMPVAMPTWRKVELMPEAMPPCRGRHDADGGGGERRVDQADPGRWR